MPVYRRRVMQFFVHGEPVTGEVLAQVVGVRVARRGVGLRVASRAVSVEVARRDAALKIEGETRNVGG